MPSVVELLRSDEVIFLTFLDCTSSTIIYIEWT